MSGGSPTQFEINKKLKAKIATLEEEVKTLRRRVKAAEFWSKWVYPEGAKPADIQNELMDYHYMLGEVGKVYDHITRGRISKPNTRASSVIGVVEEVNQEYIAEALKDYQEYIGPGRRGDCR